MEIIPVQKRVDHCIYFNNRLYPDYSTRIKQIAWEEFILKITFREINNPHEVDFQILINGENTTLDSKEEGDNYA